MKNVKQRWEQRALAESLDPLMEKKFFGMEKNQLYNRLDLQPETRQLLDKSFNNWQQRVDKYNTYSVGSLFGLGQQTIKGPVTTQAWKEVAKKNFENFRLTPGLSESAQQAGHKLTVGNYMKYGVVGNHMRSIGKFMSGEGKPLGAAFGALNIAVILGHAVKKGKDAYDQSEAKGEGFVSKIFNAVKAGGKDLLKTLISYEIGGLVYSLVAAAVPISVVGGFVALGAAIGTGVLVKKGMDSLTENA
jgi:hypothetical protein